MPGVMKFAGAADVATVSEPAEDSSLVLCYIRVCLNGMSGHVGRASAPLKTLRTMMQNVALTDLFSQGFQVSLRGYGLQRRILEKRARNRLRRRGLLRRGRRMSKEACRRLTPLKSCGAFRVAKVTVTVNKPLRHCA